MKIYAETSVFFVRLFNSLLRDGNDGYRGVFMRIRWMEIVSDENKCWS